jgi:hypothetical protein
VLGPSIHKLQIAELYFPVCECRCVYNLQIADFPAMPADV